jgi:hypothetical protein
MTGMGQGLAGLIVTGALGPLRPVHRLARYLLGMP